jgi:hypothetical protein
MEKTDFVNEFSLYNLNETQYIFDVFEHNLVDKDKLISFYRLLVTARELCYKYNAYLYYEPFEKKTFNNWEFFIIKNKKEILLQVYYTSNYDIQRIEDNLTALYY